MDKQLFNSWTYKGVTKNQAFHLLYSLEYRLYSRFEEDENKRKEEEENKEKVFNKLKKEFYDKIQS
jgi:hypothetical protein